MRAIPLAVLFTLSLSAAAGADEGALGGLKRMAPKGRKAKAAAPARAKAVKGRHDWKALTASDWTECKPPLETDGSPSYKRMKSAGKRWRTATVEGSGKPVFYVCAAGRWFDTRKRPESVSLSKDGKEIAFRVADYAYARLRAQDLPSGAGPHRLSPHAWLWAELADWRDGMPALPIELRLEPATGLAGNGFALAVVSLEAEELLGPSLFAQPKARRSAKAWIDEEIAGRSGRVTVKFWPSETAYATSSGTMYKQGIEVEAGPEDYGDDPRLTEYTLKQRLKKARKRK